MRVFNRENLVSTSLCVCVCVCVLQVSQPDDYRGVFFPLFSSTAKKNTVAIVESFLDIVWHKKSQTPPRPFTLLYVHLYPGIPSFLLAFIHADNADDTTSLAHHI